MQRVGKEGGFSSKPNPQCQKGFLKSDESGRVEKTAVVCLGCLRERWMSKADGPKTESSGREAEVRQYGWGQDGHPWAGPKDFVDTLGTQGIFVRYNVRH